jgi:hypothetical protein
LKLVIAEKPSVGAALAAVLGAKERKDIIPYRSLRPGAHRPFGRLHRAGIQG